MLVRVAVRVAATIEEELDEVVQRICGHSHKSHGCFNFRGEG